MARDDQSAQGVLELHPKGYGFLRNAARNYVAQPADAYVPARFIQKLGLREGLLLAGPVEPARKGSRPAPGPASSRSRACRRSSTARASSTTSRPSTRTNRSAWKPARSR